ncbi:hypothetical protein JZ00_25635 [Pseudomonas frederiksbergensis]|uniref:Uncharacterized protein n=1 Tax=Pseudomonas frederiksbergensis TaxID=104087 RepID=A0A0B1YYA6_9PSED|nr:hypothetical protein JZ00_25635 [Pseudomonas frederiksbergensis]
MLTKGSANAVFLAGLCRIVDVATLSLADRYHQDDDPFVFYSIDESIPSPAQLDLVAILHCVKGIAQYPRLLLSFPKLFQ